LRTSIKEDANDLAGAQLLRKIESTEKRWWDSTGLILWGPDAKVVARSSANNRIYYSIPITKMQIAQLVERVQGVTSFHRS
jgi:hypothetical protein